MEKLELKHIAPYLPYRLKCLIPKHSLKFGQQYVLPVNGASIDSYGLLNIEFILPDDDLLFSNQLKWVKPLLRPLSDLTQEIEHNGERFVPIIELFKLHNKNDFRVFPYSENYELDHYSHCVIYDDKNIFGYSNHGSFVGFTPGYCNFLILNQIELIEKLYEWHFDVFELIDKGLAIRKERGV